MNDTYHIPLESVTLDEYEKILGSKELLPGRKVLKEDFNFKFNLIRSEGIVNLKELFDKLKTKKKMDKFADETGLSNNYLTILRREINSYQPKPVNLENFPGINQDHVQKLGIFKIKNSKQLFNKVQNKYELLNLSEQSKIPINDLLELLKLSDLVRISGVGPVFSRMIVDVGIDSTVKMANSNAKILFNKLSALNLEKNYTKAKFTNKDIQYCIDFAKKLPKNVEMDTLP